MKKTISIGRSRVGWEDKFRLAEQKDHKLIEVFADSEWEEYEWEW